MSPGETNQEITGGDKCEAGITHLAITGLTHTAEIIMWYISLLKELLKVI